MGRGEPGLQEIKASGRTKGRRLKTTTRVMGNPEKQGHSSVTITSGSAPSQQRSWCWEGAPLSCPGLLCEGSRVFFLSDKLRNNKPGSQRSDGEKEGAQQQ